MSEQLISGLTEDPLFKELTEKQQKFLLSYLESSDSTAACQSVFDCQTKQTAQVMGYKLLQHFKIRKLLFLYRDRATAVPSTMSRSEFLALLSERLRDPNMTNDVFFRLSSALLEVTGWKPRRRSPNRRPEQIRTEAEAETEQPTASSSLDIDAMVRQIEQSR